MAKWIPWLPALAAILCGLCCIKRPLRKLAAIICILGIFGSFLITLGVASSIPAYEPGQAAAHSVHAFEWIRVGDLFQADMAYFLDPLTLLMLCVVTGIGTLVAIYASGYMAGDRGYARFFAVVGLFIFAMTSLVMADNLVLLYLGWEGVGLCSYLLIGYYYDKPSAVAAAKKAFIVNRIGDVGFAIGIFLTYVTFDTVSLSQVIDQAAALSPAETTAAHAWIPFLLMIGAFGKSAQIPLYVWLPDAMEGPTPVSALIHAATMVTAGVYMIVRLLPVFVLSPAALPVVAIIGTATALFAATIAMGQYDLKKIYAYSTISQLGFMFLGVGALSAVGGVFHLFTHAFFKALLFLTAGSVMHALAGQLDLRKISGLRTRMPVTCWLMFLGCLALAGFPLTAGFYSKDMILAAAIERGLLGEPLYLVLGLLGMFTAFLTAFYTFRLWFRVFMGPTEYEMGTEHHGADDAHAHAGNAKEQTAGEAQHAPGHVAHEHHHEPHEVSWLMNAPLVVLAIGAVAAGFLFEHYHWSELITGSTAGLALHDEHAHMTLFGREIDSHQLHVIMMIASSVIAIAGIGLAAYYHWFNRPAADRAAAGARSLVTLLNNKYYIDEIYDATIVRPLRALGELAYAFDRLVIDGLVAAVGLAPRLLGKVAQPAQRGVLQGYGLGMAMGVALLALLTWLIIRP